MKYILTIILFFWAADHFPILEYWGYCAIACFVFLALRDARPETHVNLFAHRFFISFFLWWLVAGVVVVALYRRLKFENEMRKVLDQAKDQLQAEEDAEAIKQHILKGFK